MSRFAELEDRQSPDLPIFSRLMKNVLAASDQVEGVL